MASSPFLVGGPRDNCVTVDHRLRDAGVVAPSPFAHAIVTTTAHCVGVAPHAQRRQARCILLIVGTHNQTTQMHQIAQELPDLRCAFTPYFADGLEECLRRAGLAEATVLGARHRQRCLDYLRDHDLEVDLAGSRGRYDLVLSCSDLLVPRSVRRQRLVLVQEGILDATGPSLPLVQRLRFLPRWLAGTAASGLSLAYERFCVASPGYRDHFVSLGVPGERIAVTGIPNFDDCARYLSNDFPHRGFALACTSDARETLVWEDRPAFLRRCVEIAAGRALFVKLHPNENAARARREIARWAPKARVFDSGSAEEMIANCDVLITKYSSTTFVGLALGKEVHSELDLDELRGLMPLQNRCAAPNIAQVCRELLGLESGAERTRLHSSSAVATASAVAG
jgi:hypothetical protein